MKNFALIGAAGYIAERHVKAIKDLNCDLKFITDPSDTVGYIDKYFPKSKYFKEIERFDRNINRNIGSQNSIDFISICSPNYLHDSHIRLGLRNESNVICEKPLVLKKDHLIQMLKLEKKYKKKIFPILQLRLHPLIQKLKKEKNSNNKIINLTYITPRGSWYDYSWKGDFDKSGGILFNIGVHFFDMLIWLFGEPRSFRIDYSDFKKCKGKIFLDQAEVNFLLSIDKKDLPHHEWKPFREIQFDGNKIDFTEGFTDLHLESYKQILNGKGFDIESCIPSIELIEKMNTSF